MTWIMNMVTGGWPILKWKPLLSSKDITINSKKGKALTAAGMAEAYYQNHLFGYGVIQLLINNYSVRL